MAHESCVVQTWPSERVVLAPFRDFRPSMAAALRPEALMLSVSQPAFQYHSDLSDLRSLSGFRPREIHRCAVVQGQPSVRAEQAGTSRRGTQVDFTS